MLMMSNGERPSNAREEGDTKRYGRRGDDTWPPLLLRLPDAAEQLGISVSLLRRLIVAQRIPVVRIGRRVLVAQRTLEELADDGVDWDDPV